MNWFTPFTEQGMTDELYATLKRVENTAEFWQSSAKFVYSIEDRKFESLSLPQQDWLLDIIAFLNVETNRQTAKILFNDFRSIIPADETLRNINLAVGLDRHINKLTVSKRSYKIFR